MNAKFRMWDDFTKKYIFTGYHVVGEVTVFGGMEWHINKTMRERKEIRGYKTTTEAWNDFTEEQFTGIKDRDGTDIYDGDIIRSGKTNFSIRYAQADCAFMAFYTSADGTNRVDFIRDALSVEGYQLVEGKIIGNLHENLELAYIKSGD